MPKINKMLACLSSAVGITVSSFSVSPLIDNFTKTCIFDF